MSPHSYSVRPSPRRTRRASTLPVPALRPVPARPRRAPRRRSRGGRPMAEAEAGVGMGVRGQTGGSWIGLGLAKREERGRAGRRRSPAGSEEGWGRRCCGRCSSLLRRTRGWGGRGCRRLLWRGRCVHTKRARTRDAATLSMSLRQCFVQTRICLALAGGATSRSMAGGPSRVLRLGGAGQLGKRI